MWNRLVRHPITTFTILYLLCVGIFLASLALPRIDGQLTGSDGASYYAYLPSLLLDRDLDFTNQYSVLLPAGALDQLARTPAGLPHNKYAIGAAILWMPFFLVGHGIALAMSSAGYAIRLDGLSHIHQASALIGSITYGFLGILLLYRCCNRFFTRSISLGVCILTWLATNLIYYMIAEPSMSHACSFFAAALFLNLWLSFRPHPTLLQWAILGASGGLIALVRQPDAVWLGVPFLDMLISCFFTRLDRIWEKAAGLFVFAFSAFILFLPQMLVWGVLNGTATQAGYQYAGEHFDFSRPSIWQLLFSFNHGLCSWHPVLLPAVLGLALLPRKDKAVSAVLGTVFLLQLGIIGSWPGWWGGDSFGGRMLVSSLPILALGLAAFLEWASARPAAPVLGYAAVSLVLWNALFFAQYRFGYIPKNQSLTLSEMTLGKWTVLKTLPSRLMKPKKAS